MFELVCVLVSLNCVLFLTYGFEWLNCIFAQIVIVFKVQPVGMLNVEKNCGV